MNFIEHKILIKQIICLISFAYLSGCQSIPADLGGDAGPLFRRGVVSINNDGLSFKPCYVNKAESINDRTGKLAKRFKHTQAPVFYAELSGDHFVTGEPWEVYKVHLMGGDQLTCQYELSGNKYRAAGNKPLWIADVREDGIYVQNYGRLAQLVFPRKKPISLGNGYEWNSQLQGIARYSLALKVLETRCTDQFGIDYEYTSQMTLNSHVYSGCAREGNLEVRTLPGLYSALLPGMNSLGRFISLDLTSDNEAFLTQDYRNRQPLIEQIGTWKTLSEGKVVVYLTEIDGRKENEILIFQRDKQGALKLKGHSATYGTAGLRLERVGPERAHRRFSR